MIFVAQKGKLLGKPLTFTQVKSLAQPYPDIQAIILSSGQSLSSDAFNGKNWSLTDASSAAYLQKLELAGIPLAEYVQGQIYRGLVTGLNKAFYIDDLKRAELIAKDPNSAEVIKPLVVGDNIRAWRIDYKQRWMIALKIGVDIKRYPAIFSHLNQWRSELEKRWDKGNHWWELRACAYYSEFEKPKIVYPDICKESRFTYDSAGYYLDATATCIATDDLYLLGLLNSKLVWRYVKEKCAVLGDAKRGGRIRLKTFYVEQIPIPQASPSDRQIISALVQQCLDARGQGVEDWEAEINDRVAHLYRLTPDEIKLINEG